MSADIPASVVSLLREHICSIAQLEILLKLHGEAGREWSVSEAAKDLYTAVSMTQPLLEALRSSGLLSRRDDAEARYRYEPKSPELAIAVDELAQLYQQRRITIINLIYSGPSKSLQNFADAFRIRDKEKEE
jgi:DNA-binding IclR family transcriptional regulator